MKWVNVTALIHSKMNNRWILGDERAIEDEVTTRGRDAQENEVVGVVVLIGIVPENPQPQLGEQKKGQQRQAQHRQLEAKASWFAHPRLIHGLRHELALCSLVVRLISSCADCSLAAPIVTHNPPSFESVPIQPSWVSPRSTNQSSSAGVKSCVPCRGAAATRVLG